MQLLPGNQLPPLEKEPLYERPVEELIDFIPPPGPPPGEQDIWPKNIPCPLDIPGAHAYADYPASLMDKLKSRAKEHGVATLNPVLEVAYVATLISITPTTDDFNWNTIRDNRNDCEDQAPVWSSNYFSAPSTLLRPLPSADFWQLAKSHAKHLKNPATIQRGRHGIGGLQHIPMPLDRRLLHKVQSNRPYIGSVLFTNMTRLDLPPGTQDFHWTSSPSPFLCAVIIHWVGHKAGLRMSLPFQGRSRDH